MKFNLYELQRAITAMMHETCSYDEELAKNTEVEVVINEEDPGNGKFMEHVSMSVTDLERPNRKGVFINSKLEVFAKSEGRAPRFTRSETKDVT